MHEHYTGYLEDAWRRLRSNSAAMFALITLSLLFFLAIVGPVLSPYSYAEIHLELKNTPPCWKFICGSDELGRDLFTRLWWGARISLFIGITAATIDVIVGMVWGSIAAFAGGKQMS